MKRLWCSPRGTPITLLLLAAVLFAAAPLMAGPTSQIIVTKTSNPPTGSIIVGQSITFTITIQNNGPNGSPQGSLTDTLPDGFVPDSFAATVPDTCMINGQTITCSIQGIGNGKNDTVVIHAHVVAGFETIDDNCATWSTDDAQWSDAGGSQFTGCTDGGWTVVQPDDTPTALELDREAATGTASDVNRVFEPNETVRMDPTWMNNLGGPISFTGSLDGMSFTGPGDPAHVVYSIMDDTADYGMVAGGAESDCNAATGDCYLLSLSLDDPANRPAIHWDTTVDETLSTGETKQWQIHIGDSFSDIPRSNIFYRFVETIFHNRITVGGGNSCPNTQYCYGDPTQRDQMTGFIARGMQGMDSLVPSSGTGYDCAGATSNFSDTPPGSTFCRHANFAYVNHIVSGCGGGLLCAQSPTSRGEVAIFIARALQWLNGHTADPDSFVPTSGTDGMTRTYDCTQVGMGPFPDVPYDSVFCKYVGYLWVNHIVDGFTSGPNTGNYGPALDIRRDEISKVLANAFVNLPLYGPTVFPYP
jgi:uncharacterized repeat protein (TIGR01451 family)